MRYFNKISLSISTLVVVIIIAIIGFPSKANANSQCNTQYDGEFNFTVCIYEENYRMVARASYTGYVCSVVELMLRDDTRGAEGKKAQVASEKVALPCLYAKETLPSISVKAQNHSYHAWVRLIDNNGNPSSPTLGDSPSLFGYTHAPRITYNTKTNHKWSNKHNAFLRN